MPLKPPARLKSIYVISGLALFLVLNFFAFVPMSYLLAKFSSVAVAYGVLDFDPCETEVAKTILSPGGDKNLIVFHRDCGATTDFNTQVSLLPSGKHFSFDEFPAFFSVGGLHDLKIDWLSNREVRIAVPKAERVYRRERGAGDVSIIYQ